MTSVYPVKDTPAVSYAPKRLFRDNSRYLSKQLYHAVREGDDYMVVDIFSQKSGLNLIDTLDENSLSALHYAVKYKRLSIINILLKYKADVNVKGHDNYRPLHLAANQNCFETGSILLKSRNINVDVANDKGETPLHLACRRGHLEFIQLLLDHKADVRKVEKDSETVLHHPTRLGYIKVVDLLLAQPNTPLNGSNDNGITPFMVACIEGHVYICEKLLGATKNNKKRREILKSSDKDGNTPLMNALQNRHVELFEACIEWGADIHAQTCVGRTALHIACSLGLVECIDKLVQLGVDVNVEDATKRTPLHECALNDHSEAAKQLVTAGADVNAVDWDLNTPLHYSCRRRLTQMAETLLGLGARMSPNNSVYTPLHIAVMDNNIELAEALLTKSESQGSLTDILNDQDKDDQTALHYAATNGNLALCELLVTKGASTSLVNRSEKLPLHMTVIHGHLECLKWFRQHAPSEVDRPRDRDEMNALLMAAEKGQAEIFDYLSSTATTDVNAKDEFGRNALMFACQSGCDKIVETILHTEIDINLQDLAKNSPMHYAATGNHPTIIQMLLDHNAVLNENNYGQTPFEVALKTRKEAVVEVFLNDKNWLNTIKYRHKDGTNQLDSIIIYHPHRMETLLDRCLMESTENEADPDYRLVFDFRLVDPGPDDSASANKRYFALNTMSKTENEKLLQHPICQKVLHLKRKQFGRIIFALDCLFYLTFLACLTTFVLIHNPPTSNQIDWTTGCSLPTNGTSQGRSQADGGSILIQIIILVFLGVRVFLELVKFLGKGIYYFSNWQVFAYLLLYALTAAFIRNPVDEPCLYEWYFGAVSVFLAWFLLLFQFDQLPHAGVYILMFQSVLVSLVKVLLVFAMLLIGFTLAFYITLRSMSPFNDVGKSFMKTIDMTIGELELVDYFFGNTSPFQTVSYVLFMIFAIVMPIAMMNLLIGIAVGDIDGIRREANLRSIAMQVDYVYNIETKFFIRPIQRRMYTPSHEEKEAQNIKAMREKVAKDQVDECEDEDDRFNVMENRINDKLDTIMNAINSMK